MSHCPGGYKSNEERNRPEKQYTGPLEILIGRFHGCICRLGPSSTAGVATESCSSLGLFDRVRGFLQLLDPPSVNLAMPMRLQGSVGFVVSAKVRSVAAHTKQKVPEHTLRIQHSNVVQAQASRNLLVALRAACGCGAGGHVAGSGPGLFAAPAI